MASFLRHRRLQRTGVLALLVVWLAPLCLPHTKDDDPACAAVAGLGKETGSALDPGSPDSSPDHCVVCHTARSFRSAAADGGSLSVGLSPGLYVETPADLRHRNAAFDRLPARAPPAPMTAATAFC